MSGALAIFHHCARNEDCKDSKACLQPPLLLSASGEWTKRLPTEPDNFYNQGYKNTGQRAAGTQLRRGHLCFMVFQKRPPRAGSHRKMQNEPSLKRDSRMFPEKNTACSKAWRRESV